MCKEHPRHLNQVKQVIKLVCQLQALGSNRQSYPSTNMASQVLQQVRKVAFVTGANGISGHAIVEHLIRQPESEWYDTALEPFIAY